MDFAEGKATIRDDNKTRTAAAPRICFPANGYAPVAMQQALVRFWRHRGRPATLTTLPNGAVQITPRGHDTVALNGKPTLLDRYQVRGLVWGGETLWLDHAENLVAVVTTDAEFDHFEAVRDGYESALPDFIRRAAQDNLDALTHLTQRLSPPRQGTFALIGATVIDGTGRPPLSNATVVVSGKRIVAVGPAAQVVVPSGATRIDVRGKYLLPGLWDMHAHYEQVEWGPIYLAAGVTTVRDCGNEFDYITTVRDAINSGRGIGPRLVLAGLVDGDGPQALGIVRANTPEQARNVVQRYKDAGFAQIKIYSSIKPALVPVITAEAHRLGLSVTGHIPDGMNAIQGVEAGMDQINHIQYLAPVLLRRPPPAASATPSAPPSLPTLDENAPETRHVLDVLRQHGTVIDPTLVFYELTFHPADTPIETFEPGINHVAPELKSAMLIPGVPAAFAARAKSGFALFLAIVGLLHRNGIPIVAGTDQSVPGYSLHREMELYVQTGMTPMEAIQSATLVPARALKMESEVGTVEAGKRADLILVDGNPLEDIRRLRNVLRVIAGGRLYDPAPLWRSVGFQP